MNSSDKRPVMVLLGASLSQDPLSTPLRVTQFRRRLFFFPQRVTPKILRGQSIPKCNTGGALVDVDCNEGRAVQMETVPRCTAHPFLLLFSNLVRSSPGAYRGRSFP